MYLHSCQVKGLKQATMISTIGAFLMAVGVIVIVINIIITSVKNVKVGNDPWGDGRTLEWAIPSPPPYYNFKQTSTCSWIRCILD